MSRLGLLSDTSVDDPELVRRITNHDEAAFETVMRRYNGALFRVARAILKNTVDAEDVLQEVFAAAFNAVLSDEREINVRPWLYRIARNRSLNHLRRASAVGVETMAMESVIRVAMISGPLSPAAYQRGTRPSKASTRS